MSKGFISSSFEGYMWNPHIYVHLQQTRANTKFLSRNYQGFDV